jgi:septum formation protein
VTTYLLASSSPRRTELLRQWGIPHDIFPADIAEREPSADCLESIEELTERNARAKAESVAELVLEDRRKFAFPIVVIGSDTLVECDGERLTKPRDENDAVAILMRLSGRVVRVVSAIALVRLGDDRRIVSGTDLSLVRMRPFDRRTAVNYVATGEPMGKAGAFAVQGLGRDLVTSVDGSISNVIGMGRELFERLAREIGEDGRRS